MNRENTGAKPTAPPRLPPEAEQEILEALFEGMEIHSSEIAAILKKHGVCGDVEALQDSYRKRLGQRGSWPVSGMRVDGVRCWPTEKAAMWCWRAAATGGSSSRSTAVSKTR